MAGQAVKVMWYSWACLRIKNFIIFQNWKITKELLKVPFNFKKELLKEPRLIMTSWHTFLQETNYYYFLPLFSEHKIGLEALKDYKECNFEKSHEHLQQFDQYIFFKQQLIF